MSFTDAVYLGAIVEAVLFFTAGYFLHASKNVGRAAAPPPTAASEVGVDELIHELEREQATRRQHEQTIQQLQQMIGQLQMR
jgi:hypothetical protein